MDRWFRAQPKEQAEARLRKKLDLVWRESLAAKNTNQAGIVVEATRRWLGSAAAESLAPAALELAREALRSLEERGRADWRDAGIGPGLLLLLETYGVPADVDLTAVARAARRYYREMADESIPLPHPYNLELETLRIERLRDRNLRR